MAVWQTLTVRGRWVSAAGAGADGGRLQLELSPRGRARVVLGVLVLVELVAVLASRDLAVHRTVSPLVVVRQGPCEGHLRCPVAGARG